MRTIGKYEKKEHAVLVGRLSDVRADVEAAADAFNSAIAPGSMASRETIEAAHAKLAGAIEDYNLTLSDARDLVDSVVGMMDDYASDRAEGWDETPSGEQFLAWKDAWEGADLDEIDEVEPLPPVDSEDTSEDYNPCFDSMEAFEDLPFNKADA